MNLPYSLQQGTVDPIYNVENFVKEAKFRIQSAHKEANRLIEKIKHNKRNFDRTANPVHLHINDRVLVEKEPYHKHRPIYIGPLLIKIQM